MYLRAILLTEELCFAARVLSRETAMTQRRRLRRHTFCAIR